MQVNTSMLNFGLFCTETKFLRRNSPSCLETNERRAPPLLEMYFVCWQSIIISLLNKKKLFLGRIKRKLEEICYDFFSVNI